MPALLQGAVLSDPGDALPQRILLVENSRTFTSMLREAIEQRLELPVSVATSLAEAGRLLDEEQGWFLVLTGLVLADGDRDTVVDYFLSRGLPTVVVSGVYDEDLRKRVLQQEIIDYVLKNTPGSVDYLVWLVQLTRLRPPALARYSWRSASEIRRCRESRCGRRQHSPMLTVMRRVVSPSFTSSAAMRSRSISK